MNKKLRRTMKTVRKYVRKWSWMVTKWGWQFDVFYHDRYEDLSHEDWGEFSENTAAFVRGSFQYLQGSMHVILEHFVEMDEAGIEAMVVHELSHFLVFPLQESQLAEYTVETISRVLLMAHNGAGDDGE